MVKYTFTFQQQDEGKFREVLSRLDSTEYNIIEDVKLVDDTQPRYSDKEAIVEMDPESCLTFRLGMKQVKIRRARSEEELAEEEEIINKHKIKITVQVPMGDPGV